jgi:cytochrome c551/c552
VNEAIAAPAAKTTAVTYAESKKFITRNTCLACDHPTKKQVGLPMQRLQNENI